MQKTHPEHHKYLTLLSIFYVIILLVTLVVENRVIMLGSMHLLSGSLILPLSYALSDVITEVYGYRVMRRLIWQSLVVLYVVALVIFLILLTPTDTSNSIDLAYNASLKFLPANIITYSIASVSSIFLNSYLLSKWKIRLHGRFFWMRSLGSTLIGELIFILVWSAIGFVGVFPLKELLQIMVMSYLCKFVYNIIMITFAAMLAARLKRVENTDIYDRSVNFNPFSLKVE